ncbi:MAG: hypothetical protein WDZ89_03345, partial [Gemmatimonadota bacterium]
MNVVDVPPSLDHRSVDRLFDAVEKAADGKALFDARRLRWVDPQGMIGLLAAGTVARDRSGSPPHLQLPESDDVLGYLARMGFFREASGIFTIDGRAPSRAGGQSDVLLE